MRITKTSTDDDNDGWNYDYDYDGGNLDDNDEKSPKNTNIMTFSQNWLILDAIT